MPQPRTHTYPTRPTDLAGIFARGFAMGAADIVPGVSGGTMAFILGIYEQLIDAIALFTRGETLKLVAARRWSDLFALVPWRFLVALAAGLLTAVFALAHALEWTLEHHPVPLWAFFFGLVLASVFTISRHIAWTPNLIAAALATALAAWWIVGLVPTRTPETWWFLILSGAIAICAMILPGISGAFVLVVLGKYQYVLGAVNDRDFVTLGLVAVGAVLGLLTFARFVSWTFERYHDLTIAALTGLLLGSLRKVWPWKVELPATGAAGDAGIFVERNVMPTAFGTEVLAAIGLAALGLILVLMLERMAARVGG